MNPIETKIKDKLNLVPQIAEEIASALEAAKICGNEKLDLIIPAIGKNMQVVKVTDGKYKASFILDGGAERLNDAGDSLTIKEWIDDYVFEPELKLPAGAEGFIKHEDSLNCSAENLQKIADGKLIVLPAEEVAAAADSIPSSQLVDKTSHGKISLEDISSGKTKVDMSK